MDEGKEAKEAACKDSDAGKEAEEAAEEDADDGGSEDDAEEGAEDNEVEDGTDNDAEGQVAGCGSRSFRRDALTVTVAAGAA